MKMRTYSQAACLLAATLMLWSVTGCKSNSPSRYVSPRVIGRVLDADTRQPIAGVEVKRVLPDYEAGTLDQVKGGQIMARPAPLRTAEDGTFNLDSEKALSVFRQIAWFTAEISFTHRGYETFVTNYTPRDALFQESGEGIIHAGDIHMMPKVKLQP